MATVIDIIGTAASVLSLIASWPWRGNGQHRSTKSASNQWPDQP